MTSHMFNDLPKGRIYRFTSREMRASTYEFRLEAVWSMMLENCLFQQALFVKCLWIAVNECDMFIQWWAILSTRWRDKLCVPLQMHCCKQLKLGITDKTATRYQEFSGSPRQNLAAYSTLPERTFKKAKQGKKKTQSTLLLSFYRSQVRSKTPKLRSLEVRAVVLLFHMFSSAFVTFIIMQIIHKCFLSW